MSNAINAAVVAALIQLPSPTGSGYNEEWNIKLNGGDVLHNIELETNLKNKKTIRKITLDIGGNPVVSPRGETLDLLDKLYGVAMEEGRLVLDLSKFEHRSPVGVYRTAVATSVFDDVTLKIEFGERDTSDADPANHDPAIPTLKAKAYVSKNPMRNTVGGGRVYVPIKYDLTQYAAAAGKHDWIFPSGKASRFIQRMIFDESETQIQKIIVKRGTETLREMTRKDIEFGQRRYAGITPQAGYLLVDFTQFGFGANDALPTHGLNFEFETTSSGAIKTFVDGFDRVA